jgi:hypothetical protein
VGNHESIFNWSINVAYPESPSVTVPHMNPVKGDSRFENNDLLYSTVHARHGIKTIPIISGLWALHSSLVAHLDSETIFFVTWATSGELSSFLFICRFGLNEEKWFCPFPKAAIFSMFTVARLWLALRIACSAFSSRLVPSIHHRFSVCPYHDYLLTRPVSQDGFNNVSWNLFECFDCVPLLDSV